MALVQHTGNDGPDPKKRKFELVPALEKELVALPGSADRKSGLLAPTMLLSGHEAEVFCMDFSPDGRHLVSGGYDKTLQVWNVYGECENFCQLRGHTNAILECHWNPEGKQVYSCSADMSCAVFDIEAGKRVKKLSGHSAIVEEKFEKYCG